MSSQNSDNNNSPAVEIITLPFPPNISAQDFIDRRSPERVTAKSPNAFFVYRKAFVNYLQTLNHNLKMREVSSMAGLSWKAAPKEVKDAYKRIAHDVERIIISQRQKRYKEYTENLNKNVMTRPIYLPYHFHDSTSYYLQQLPSMPVVNTWFSATSNHSEGAVYPQYDSLSSNLYESDQTVPIMGQYHNQPFDQEFDQEFNQGFSSQQLTQQNFTPINSAIDQFDTDIFNEDDYIYWHAQNNEEKQQD